MATALSGPRSGGALITMRPETVGLRPGRIMIGVCRNLIIPRRGVMEDKILFKANLPRPLPDLKLAVVKSGRKGRWTVFLRLHTGERADGAYYYEHISLIQIRAWWFPVLFFRGWIRRG